MSTITWLHLSDPNFSSTRRYDTQIVLDALLKDIRERTNVSPGLARIDFIVVTGDIGFSGQREEYELAEQFFDKLLSVTSLNKKALLFLIPGNHDVDWNTVSSFAVTDKERLLNQDTIRKFLNNDEERTEILTKFQHYRDFVNSYLSGLLPFDSTQYFYVRLLTIAGKKIAILGLNSAWLSGPNPYRSYPLLGEKQVQVALEKSRDADVRIAIMHHAPDSLGEADQIAVVPLLLRECAFILHGHIHPGGISSLVTPDSEATVIGSGAIYGSREYANSYNFVCLDLEAGKGEIYLRRYSDERGGFWARDTLTYRNVLDGSYSFSLPSRIMPPKTLAIAPVEPKGPIGKTTIMHLSDLQFGRHHADRDHRKPLYRDDKAYDDELAKLEADLKRVKAAYGISPDFIVVTGDITEWSLGVEYETAERFLVGLANACGISRQRVLMVPGNHDVNRDLCQAERLTAKALGIEFRPPYFGKFELYQKFFNNFYRSSTPETLSADAYKFTEELFVSYPFAEHGLLFIGLNSCVMESERDEDHFGWVSIDQLQRAIKACDLKDPNRELFRVVLMHHNFRRDSYNDNENLRDADDLEAALCNAEFKLLLHGHQHTPKATLSGVSGKSLHILATGSAGLDGETLPENARRCQYIVIEGKHVSVYRRRFETQARDETGKGCWVSDPLPEDSPLFHGGSATLSFEI